MSDSSNKREYFAATRYQNFKGKHKAEELCESEEPKRTMGFVPFQRFESSETEDEADPVRVQDYEPSDEDEIICVQDCDPRFDESDIVRVQEYSDSNSETDDGSITLSESSSGYSYPDEDDEDFDITKEELDSSDDDYASDSNGVDDFGDDETNDDDAEYGLENKAVPAQQIEVIVISDDDEAPLVQVGLEDLTLPLNVLHARLAAQ